jgi:hypothetical protein
MALNSSALSLVFVSALFALPALAQSSPASTATPFTPQQDLQYKAQFSKGFRQGCLTTKSPLITNPVAFCGCLLNAYQSRYSGQALASIVALSSQSGSSGPRLVDLMMYPERQACLKTSR